MGDKTGKIEDSLPGVARVGTPFAEEIKKTVGRSFGSQFHNNNYGAVDGAVVRVYCDDFGPGKWQWAATYSLPRDYLVRGMRSRHAELSKGTAEARKEMDALYEEYTRQDSFSANIGFLLGIGAVGDYRRKRRQVSTIENEISELERRINCLQNNGWWEEEVENTTYLVYPSRMVMVLATDFFHEKREKWHLSIKVYGQDDAKKSKQLCSSARDLAKDLQAQYSWLDISLEFSEEPQFYRKPKP